MGNCLYYKSEAKVRTNLCLLSVEQELFILLYHPGIIPQRVEVKLHSHCDLEHRSSIQYNAGVSLKLVHPPL